MWPDAPNRDKPGRRVLVAAADIRDWKQPWCFANGTQVHKHSATAT